jgi:hypothetical protein
MRARRIKSLDKKEQFIIHQLYINKEKIKPMKTKELSNERKGTLAAILLLSLVMNHVSLHAQVAIGQCRQSRGRSYYLDLNNGATGGG